jgi:hypothetical protein
VGGEEAALWVLLALSVTPPLPVLGADRPGVLLLGLFRLFLIANPCPCSCQAGVTAVHSNSSGTLNQSSRACFAIALCDLSRILCPDLRLATW